MKDSHREKAFSRRGEILKGKCRWNWKTVKTLVTVYVCIAWECRL